MNKRTMKKLTISTKFTLLLSLVFIGGILISGLVLWLVLQRRAESEITAQGVLLLQSMNAVRSYTNSHIKPLLDDNQTEKTTFIMESVPAFSAREVFQNLRQADQYTRFFYKEASSNPTNPLNKSDNFETDLLRNLQEHPNTPEMSGFRDLNNENVYFIARPLKVSAESCLVCHSDPASAPASLINTYGDQGGFGWELDQVVAAQIIYIPAQEIFNSAKNAFILIMGVFFVMLAVVLVLLNFLLREYVITPIGVIADLSHKVSTDEIVPADLEQEDVVELSQQADELGQLTLVFQEMAREVFARTQALKQEVQRLNVQIDEIQRKKDVQAVLNSDFFQDLEARASELRRQHREDKDGADDEA